MAGAGPHTAVNTLTNVFTSENWSMFRLPASAEEKSLVTKVSRKNYGYPACALWNEPAADQRIPMENDAKEVKDGDHKENDTCG